MFKATKVDLGPVYAESAPFRGSFAFTNATDAAVELRTKACCGSRVSFQSDKTIYAPRETGEIVFEIRGVPNSFHGPVEKQAMVFRKGDDKPVAALTLAADIRRRWHIRPTSLNFGRVKPGQTLAIEVEITAGTEEPMRVTGPSGALPAFLTVERIRETDLNGRLQYRYAVSLTGDGRARPIEETISWETSGSTVPCIKMPVKAEMVARVLARPQSVFFGEVPPGTTVHRQLSIFSTCGEALSIRSLTSVPNDVQATSFSLGDAGASIDLVFTPPSKTSGIIRGVLSVLVDRTTQGAEGSTTIEVPWVAIPEDDQAVGSSESR